MGTLQVIRSAQWTDYELIDCGNSEKLERFGKYVLRRPEPQAIWEPKLPQSDWEKLPDATYIRTKDKADMVWNSEKGNWINHRKMPESWMVKYHSENLDFTMRLALTAFGHIGVFPEQSVNWEFIAGQVRAMKCPEKNVLNLFAYTGAASIAASMTGAVVTHVDSVKQTITWANSNHSLSKGKDNIRWVVEDAVRFVGRELRRGNSYNGIILDPPAYGRGPAGEKWLLIEGLNALVADCAQILDKENFFFLINIYSVGLSAIVVENVVKSHFPEAKTVSGEITIPSQQGVSLPLGVYVRFGS
ncbi:MAG: class I SAM-dependent methyltransferase [Bacteroidetes bacterium]|nr:class I SAM-dependent methyltransferase [Bacteroidota bacterium]MBU1718585.1 class I SAM-dependent methyltransferase [Bacteroidota bacterium]